MISSASRSACSNETGAPARRVIRPLCAGHSGRAAIAARAGIHNHRQWLWIPGSRASPAPRNDQSSASCQAVPARVGPKALAVTLRQPFELGADVCRAARSRVMHGPAAERRKAGGKNHRGIDRILVRDDAFAQAADGDVEHRKNEAIGHLLGGLRRIAVLHRLAVAPLVKTSAGLAPEVAELHLAAQRL